MITPQMIENNRTFSSTLVLLVIIRARFSQNFEKRFFSTFLLSRHYIKTKTKKHLMRTSVEFKRKERANKP